MRDHRPGRLCRTSEESLLTVLEAALLTDRRALAFALGRTFTFARTAFAAALSRCNLERTQVAGAGRSRDHQRIVLQREVNYASIARRHRIQSDGLVVALG